MMTTGTPVSSSRFSADLGVGSPAFTMMPSRFRQLSASSKSESKSDSGWIFILTTCRFSRIAPISRVCSRSHREYEKKSGEAISLSRGMMKVPLPIRRER